MTPFIKVIPIIFLLCYLYGCGSAGENSDTFQNLINTDDSTDPSDLADGEDLVHTSSDSTDFNNIIDPSSQPGDVLYSISYPEGISFIGDIVYSPTTNSIWFTAGNSTKLPFFFQMDTSGNIIKKVDNNSFWINHGSELTFDGINLWATSYGWKSGVPQAFIFKLDLNGNIINQFSCPASSTGGFCEGLAWDGQYLWSASSDNKNLVKFTKTGEVETTYINQFSTVGRNTHLMFEPSESKLISLHGGINLINPITGEMTAAQNISGFHDNTSGWDGICFWQANNSKLQIEIIYGGLFP